MVVFMLPNVPLLSVTNTVGRDKFRPWGYVDHNSTKDQVKK